MGKSQRIKAEPDDQIVIDEGDDRDDIIIDQLPETPPESEVKKPADDKAAAKEPEDAVAELKSQIERSNAERAALVERAEKAERAAQESAGHASTSVEGQIVARKAANDAAISEAQANLDSFKRQLREAKSSGDVDAEVDLQDQLNDARLKLNAANWEKGNFEKWETGYRENQKKAATAPKQATQDQQFTPEENEWIAKHPKFNSDPDYQAIAAAAASRALQDGCDRKGKAYFERIERALAKAGYDDVPAPAEKNKDPLSSAAPPSRDGNVGASRGGVVSPGTKYPYVPSGFRIPGAWVSAAQDQGMDPRKYANYMLEAEAKGELKK